MMLGIVIVVTGVIVILCDCCCCNGINRDISCSSRFHIIAVVCVNVPSSDKLILPSSNLKILSICAISCFSSSSSLSISNNNNSQKISLIIKLLANTCCHFQPRLWNNTSYPNKQSINNNLITILMTYLFTRIFLFNGS